ncbi:FAD-binding oxidoreductase [Pseudactinotalea sp. Z1748]|uniref:FAD-binding oxidoreductase n=1 Tax=Pseudactinotalea sp. Z1748 TaxID=3413027 RepID=UPI003C79C44E
MDALTELRRVLPESIVQTDPEVLQAHRRDRALDPAAGTAIAVVLAESTEHVQAAVRWAGKHRVPIVPRGLGSGLSGGASALDGGLVISTMRMRAVRIDPGTATAVVQPGVINADLKDAAAEHGLWYPPDPASFTFCSIGGNIATNAGGLCCVKYGVTGDYVLGLEVVLADGCAIRVGGPRIKDVAGLDLVGLFVGSEGTLGIITEATLRLLPQPPRARIVVGWFDDSGAAAAAVHAAARSIRPSMLEYMDQLAINCVEDELGLGLDRSAAALVIAGTDDQHPDGPEVTALLTALTEHGATDAHEAVAEMAETFVHARRIAIPAVERLGHLLLEDVGVALPRLGELIEGVQQIARDRDVPIAFIAHAGDGNTHPLVVVDPTDPAQRARAETAYGEIMDLAIDLGGTITGEHGVGRLKQPWLAAQIGADVLEVSARIKAALDPEQILNPGVILAAEPTPPTPTTKTPPAPTTKETPR